MEPTREQFGKLSDRIAPMLGYLYRLCRRLQQMGYGRHDEYYTAVDDAYTAMHSLRVKTHYKSCPPPKYGESGDQSF